MANMTINILLSLWFTEGGCAEEEGFCQRLFEAGAAGTSAHGAAPVLSVHSGQTGVGSGPQDQRSAVLLLLWRSRRVSNTSNTALDVLSKQIPKYPRF